MIYFKSFHGNRPKYLNVQQSKLYVDLPGFITSSIITGDEWRPDSGLENLANQYILELIVIYEALVNQF